MNRPKRRCSGTPLSTGKIELVQALLAKGDYGDEHITDAGPAAEFIHDVATCGCRLQELLTHEQVDELVEQSNSFADFDQRLVDLLLEHECADDTPLPEPQQRWKMAGSCGALS